VEGILLCAGTVAILVGLSTLLEAAGYRRGAVNALPALKRRLMRSPASPGDNV
jgi:hypothetical protein